MRLVVALAALVAAPAATPVEVVDRAAHRGVVATFSYQRSGDVVTEPRMRIVRRGRQLVDVPLKRVGCGGCSTWRPAGVVRIRSLDGDAEPEVFVDLYTGGAHCCTYTLIWRFDGRRYRKTLAWWGNAGYRLDDLDRRGRPELVSADDRFAAAFVVYAASSSPIRIWRYDRGRLRDVTRSFPGAVAADARVQWDNYLAFRRPPYREVRGVLAAWLADQYLLGRAGAGWRTLEAAYRRGELRYGAKVDGYPAGRAYLRNLRAFLRAKGYER